MGETEKKTFQCGDKVALALSGESGVVSGIASYADGSSNVQVTWVDGHGCQRKEWWQPHELVAA